MPNSRHTSVMASPSSRRATKRRRSSITELAFHGINTSRQKAKSVTHVSGTKCHLCLGSLISRGWTVGNPRGHPASFPAGSRERGFRKGFRVADDRSNNPREAAYKATGVDIAEADTGLNRIVERVQKTWPKHGMGRVVLPIGYYANVIEVDGVGMALCRVDLDKIIDGKAIAPGDVVIGVKSNGLHSNGYSLARRALFETGRFGIDQKFDELETTLGEELLRPTAIYVREAMEILEKVRGVKALFNITGDGLLNLSRAAAPVGYEIDQPIEPQPIFGLIQRYAEVSDAEMFEVFNMGTGFCYVVAPADVDATVAILKRHGRDARPIGHTVPDPDKKVRIPGRSLIGRHKKFRKEDRAARRAG